MQYRWIWSFILFLGCYSPSLRIYRPYPDEVTFTKVDFFPKVIVLAPTEFPEALLDHDLRRKKILKNEYGNWESLVYKELSLHPKNYPKLLQGGKIQILEFELSSVDSCFSHKASVKLKAEYSIGNEALRYFEYEDQSKNYNSNCILGLSSLTLVPLLWFIPYLGFQGNSEDQLNQLGRNAISAFFLELEKNSGKSN